MIHKRMIDDSANLSYQLCAPITVAFHQWSYADKKFSYWAKNEAKFHWKFVTCPICIEFKGKTYHQAVRAKGLIK